MPAACKSAPFGIEVTRVRSQLSPQPELDVKVIHRIAKLEFELLSIVHDHYGHEVPAVTPMYIPIQGDGGSTHLSQTCEPPPEPDSHYDGPSQSVRKLTSRFQSDHLSSQADTVDQGNKHRDTSNDQMQDFLDTYRAADAPIIHIWHKTPTGAPVFTEGTPLAEICDVLKPLESETVISKGHPGSSTGTNL
jgi:hypothetical protein